MFAGESLVAQTDSAMLEIAQFQDSLNNEYRNPKTSPLKGKAQKRFKKHEFFPADLQYRVEATLTVTDDATFFPMMTSSQVPKDYRTYGTLQFTLKGISYTVPVYQSKMLMAMSKYKDYLFFPFTDLTNGKLTYAAGRYIELSIPKSGNKIILDFNQAYNPYCAYSDGYSCPIVPADNHLDVEILAGVKYIDNQKKH
jgi:hypothetical protein